MNEISNALSSNYLLVSHSISSWSGNKTDKKATDAVITGANATASAGRFIKHALAGADTELKATKASYDAVRSYIYAHTLPYSNATSGPLKGDRLLPTVKAMKFITQVDKLTAIAEQSLDDFINVYDNRVAQAMLNLGTLAKAEDYPSKEEVRASFGFSSTFEPVPDVADFSRLQVPADMVEKFAQSVAEKQKVVMDNALTDLRKRIMQEVERVAKTLGNHFERGGVKSPIGKNLITNVKTLVGILQDVSFAENPQLDKLAEAIDKSLCANSVEQLRASPELAGKVSNNAKQIAKAIDSMEWF